jgi:lipoyl(octanoyl) transferase
MEVRRLGRIDYAASLERMRAFTTARGPDTPDELWLVEHDPVFTLGQAGRREHLLDPGDIPVLHSDRGGQVTYHGPGQVVAYVLIDLRRAGYFVKELVYRLEQSVIQVLDALDVTAQRISGAPGVYVRDPRGPGAALPPFAGFAKIAALGIKIHRGCSYHGLALNVAMDLRPYERIDPCGYAGLRAIDLAQLGVHTTTDAVARQLVARLQAHLAPRTPQPAASPAQSDFNQGPEASMG